MAQPDDDAARMVWADAVGGERRELVTLQLLARPNGAQRRRIRELLRVNGRAWSGVETLAWKVSYRRGFVDAMAIAASDFIRGGERVLAANALLEAIEFHGISQEHDLLTGVRRGMAPMETLRALLDHAAYRRVPGVGFGDIGIHTDDELDETRHGFVDQSEEAFELMVQKAAFASLTAVGVRIGPVQARTVLAGQLWKRVQTLAIDAPGVDAKLFKRLFATMPVLRTLVGSFRDDVIATVPPRVTALRTAGLDTTQLALLAAANLECLIAHHGTFPDVQLLARFSKLRSIHFSDLPVSSSIDSPPSPAQLATVKLPALRELSLSGITEADGRVIAAALGPQLGVLHFNGGNGACKPSPDLARLGSDPSIPTCGRTTVRIPDSIVVRRVTGRSAMGSPCHACPEG